MSRELIAARAHKAVQLFENTFKKLNETPLRAGFERFAHSHRELYEAAMQADANVDAATSEFVAGALDEDGFRAAGKKWFAAWTAFAKSVAPGPQPAGTTEQKSP